MKPPSARVGRNRRCAYLYTPAGILGTILIFSAPNLNGGHLLGALAVLAAAAGFVLESGPISSRPWRLR